MNEMDRLREFYETTEIPEELSQRVNLALMREEKREDKGENLKMEKEIKEKKSKKLLCRGLVAGVAAFAVLVGAFGYGVATNEAFADSMSDIPILRTLVRVFTAEQIKDADNIANIEMTLPKVEGLKDKAVEERINKEIHDRMTAVVAEAKERIAEDKKAYLETGGKEEDYMVRDIFVEYEVKAITNDVLSFLISKTETSASAYFELYYYNIDLETNKELTLEALLGENFIETANRQIVEEIAVRSQNPDNIYWDGSEGVEGFTTISDDQNFYVNEAGNPVIVFNKYEIAPGYMGIQEFEIQK